MILTIIRGLPGSGKSRFAHTLSEKSGAILIEPDMFLTQNTFYLYDKDRYFTARILARQIMATILENQASDMIYADVLPKPEDVHKLIAYVAGGDVYHIKYSVVDMPLITREESIARNLHNVLPEDIDRMFAEWRPWADGYANPKLPSGAGILYDINPGGREP